MNYTQIIKPMFFEFHEFACRHCGDLRIASELTNACDILRTRWAAPVSVSSGYRCPRHNKAIGGAPNSKHTYLLGRKASLLGGAADLQPHAYDLDGFRRWVELVKESAAGLGIGGLGVYLRPDEPRSCWTHIDVRHGKRLATWGVLNGQKTTLAKVMKELARYSAGG